MSFSCVACLVPAQTTHGPGNCRPAESGFGRGTGNWLEVPVGILGRRRSGGSEGPRPGALESRRLAMVDTATVDTLRTAEPEEALEDSTDLVEEELLVEDISIDGMCGVY